MTEAFDRALAAALLFLPRLLGAVAILVAFWIAARVAVSVLRRAAPFARLDPDLQGFLGQVAKGALIAIGIVSALGTTGFDVTALVAGLGLTTFAVGFALRDVIANVMSGLIVFAFRPFRRKDRIEVVGQAGTVVEVDMRYTTLEGADRTVLVPNSLLMTNVIIVHRTADGVPRAQV
jgi:small-conductance mechanosensitive channel